MRPAASEHPSIESLRVEMRRKLNDAECASYRGITDVGMTGTKFERLHGVTTTEELIMAQQDSILLRPSDDPGTAYLFASGIGLVASFNDEYMKTIDTHWDGQPPVKSQTLAELSAEYKDMEPTEYKSEEIDDLLNNIARNFIEWYAGLPSEMKEKCDCGC